MVDSDIPILKLLLSSIEESFCWLDRVNVQEILC